MTEHAKVKLLGRIGYVTGALGFATPVFLIMFLGAMMARGQVKGSFDAYQQIQEYGSRAAMATVPNSTTVMLRGVLAGEPAVAQGQGLLIFQERPLAGRELRWKEDFPLHFPPVSLQLQDGTVNVTADDNRVIAHELHRVADATRDREYTGFRAGDEVTIQGLWKDARLQMASGISSIGRDAIMSDGRAAFTRLESIGAVLGALSALCAGVLIYQVARARKNRGDDADTASAPPAQMPPAQVPPGLGEAG